MILNILGLTAIKTIEQILKCELDYWKYTFLRNSSNPLAFIRVTLFKLYSNKITYFILQTP